MQEDNTIPPRAKATGAKRKYKFHELNVNEYCDIKPKDKISATQSAYTYGKANGKKFVGRTVVNEDGTKQYRIYRKS
jgi:hypothetical protein